MDHVRLRQMTSSNLVLYSKKYDGCTFDQFKKLFGHNSNHLAVATNCFYLLRLLTSKGASNETAPVPHYRITSRTKTSQRRAGNMSKVTVKNRDSEGSLVVLVCVFVKMSLRKNVVRLC